MYLILGLGRSGLSTASFLKKIQEEFVVHDDHEASRHDAKKLGYTAFEENHWSHIHTLIISPGIAFCDPIAHPFVQKARAQNKTILTDINLFQKFLGPKKYVGITGTNGKSTITALTTHILKSANIKAAMGGNIGIPVLDLSSEHDVYVLELSSFQLERSLPIALNIAAFSNLTDDHIKEHGTQKAYIEAKTRIFQNADNMIICTDDENTQKIAKDYPKAFLIQTKGESNIPAVCQTHPFLKGDHNLQNQIIAYHICRIFGLTDEEIQQGLQTFTGLPHRQQYVRKLNNTTFINDSKGTSAAATTHALLAFSNIYWLLGGQDKTDGITDLIPFLSKVRKAYTFGDAAARFYETLCAHNIPCESFNTLEHAFFSAAQDAMIDSTDATVLLSPACASYDQYKNFEERGDYFMKLVKSLVEPSFENPHNFTQKKRGAL